MPDTAPIFLQGEFVYLRPLEKDDLLQLQVWLNDPALRGIIGETLPVSQAGMQAYLDRLQNDTSRVWFAIVEIVSGKLIGECGLLRMFYAWRTTDLSIIIGDPATRGKGLGREVMRLLLDYAFGYLNFHRVSIGVVGSNAAALNFYEKIGFQREGVQRDGYFYNHHYQDFIMMSILEDEYRKRYPAN